MIPLPPAIRTPSGVWTAAATGLRLLVRAGLGRVLAGLAAARRRLRRVRRLHSGGHGLDDVVGRLGEPVLHGVADLLGVAGHDLAHVLHPGGVAHALDGTVALLPASVAGPAGTQ